MRWTPIGLLLSTVLVAAGPAWGRSEPGACFATDSELLDWSTYYYQHPAPGKLPCALGYFSASKLYENQARRMPMVHFYAALLAGDEAGLMKLFEALAGRASEPARIMGLHVYWMIDTVGSRKLLDRGCAEWKTPEIERICGLMAHNKSVPILDRPLDNAGVLDNLWATFSARGDARPVERIASIVHLAEDGKGTEPALGDAARRSLTANASHHPRVREIVAGIAATAQGVQKKILEEVLAKSATAPARKPS